jgi:hypothetical protein
VIEFWQMPDVVFSQPMSTTTHTTDKTRSWELTIPRKQHFTSDEVIDAYFKGKDDGLKAGADAERTLLLKALQNNMGHAGRDTRRYSQRARHIAYRWIKPCCASTPGTASA